MLRRIKAKTVKITLRTAETGGREPETTSSSSSRERKKKVAKIEDGRD